MLDVRCFASLRERLGEQHDVPYSDQVATVAQLLIWLVAEKGDVWSVVADPKNLVAVNQEMASRSTVLRDGDEVAFFPPVTGG
jgi:molybdopterin synthase sulfur carrier subunit